MVNNFELKAVIYKKRWQLLSIFTLTFISLELIISNNIHHNKNNNPTYKGTFMGKSTYQSINDVKLDDGTDTLNEELLSAKRELQMRKFAENTQSQLQLEYELKKAEEQKRIEAEELRKKELQKEMQKQSQVKSNEYGEYTNLIKYYCDMFKFDRPDIVYGIIMAESNGDPNCSNGYAAGLTQIEYTLEDSFIRFGKQFFNEDWTLDDRYSPSKAIAFCVYTLRELYIHYNGDLDKVVQAYNYSHYSLDALIKTYGDDWKNNRDMVAYCNGVYARTGSTSYGNPRYIESVYSRMQ